jgi:nucleotide-binding universal stress UspA family protein
MEAAGTSVEGHELARMRSRYEISCDVRQAVLGDDRIGPRILVEAAKDGSDLIVIGAYWYSRLRRIMLGAATDEILR